MCPSLKGHPILELSEGPVVSFVFEGKSLQGRLGMPIAAALLSNGIHVFRTTAKRSEARSLFCGIGQCNDCVVVVNGQPNVRSCVTPLEEGMVIERQCGLGKVGVPCQ